MLGAARELFAERGYEATTVEAIARRARVSSATVYAQAGGKRGLLKSLILAWSVNDTVRDAPGRWAQVHTAAEKLTQLVEGTLRVYRDYGDLIEIGRRAAASSPVAAEFTVETRTRFRDLLATFVAQVRETGEIADALTDDEAVDVLYFYLRFEQVSLLTRDFGWSQSRAADWLCSRVASGLLART
ncbi:transcriptional regulator, TetR family [Promicromonospora thailandica]|uniref:Transcriptional regulator, TetR family n=2 Tax=Promicromonospora thailandica TaxID=765201 RepID=A0A9X2G5H6_9MICO|nr:transcriptional regulator, TetR family [Promicromonospora thailandica]